MKEKDEKKKLNEKPQDLDAEYIEITEKASNAWFRRAKKE